MELHLPKLVFGLTWWLGSCNQLTTTKERDLRMPVIEGVGAAKVTVPTIEQNGKVTGQFSSKSAYTQNLTAAANSSISGSSVSIPPGALAIDTDVSMSPTSTIGTTRTLDALGVDTQVASSGAAVSLESSTPTDTIVPFTLAIPLPDGSGLALSDPYANLAVVYFVKKISQGAASFTGIIPRSQIDIGSGYAKISTTFFGTYQTIITKIPIEKPVEKPIEPIIQTTPPPQPSTANVGYFVAQFLTTSFEPQLSGQRQEGLQGMLTWYSPFLVGESSKLSAQVLSYKTGNE